MMTNTEGDHRLFNHVRTHRRSSGLTQRELAWVIGYAHAGPVSRHERSAETPPLEIAIGYSVVFRTPVAAIFAGLRNSVEEDVEERLAELEVRLGQHSASERNARAIAQKLTWLCARRNAEPEPEFFP